MIAKAHLPDHVYDSKLEASYAEVLGWKERAHEIRSWQHHAITLKLGFDTRYTPDFLVVAADGTLECHETKGGFHRDDAKVKLKVAAALFPFRFILVTKDKQGWHFEEIPAS